MAFSDCFTSRSDCCRSRSAAASAAPSDESRLNLLNDALRAGSPIVIVESMVAAENSSTRPPPSAMVEAPPRRWWSPPLAPPRAPGEALVASARAYDDGRAPSGALPMWKPLPATASPTMPEALAGMPAAPAPPKTACGVPLRAAPAISLMRDWCTLRACFSTS